MKLRNSKVISISIHAPPDRACAFVLNGENMPKWMTSFVRSVRKSEGKWIADTAAGQMEFRFVPRNEFGVLDHWVRLPSGAEILNPMRVIPNGDGCEVMFTLFQLAETTREAFAEDAGNVARDLQTLKEILEQNHAPDPSAEATLIEHENETWRLIKQKDLVGFARHLAEDFYDIFPDGQERTKSELLEFLREAELKEFHLSNFRVTMLNDAAAIVTYHVNARAVIGGEDVSMKNLVTSGWAKRGDRWLNVSAVAVARPSENSK
jgi:ketosteroid isomerase-like protein